MRHAHVTRRRARNGGASAILEGYSGVLKGYPNGTAPAILSVVGAAVVGVHVGARVCVGVGEGVGEGVGTATWNAAKTELCAALRPKRQIQMEKTAMCGRGEPSLGADGRGEPTCC